MPKAQLGNPNVVIENVKTKERFFIGEVFIPEEVAYDGDKKDLEDLVLYWRTGFNTERPPIKLSPFQESPYIFEYLVQKEKKRFKINFSLEELDFAPASHKKCLALAVFKVD